MCPRRNNSDTASNSAKRQERETRRQEQKSRDKKAHPPKDENIGAFNNQLRAFNLQLRHIIGDGNCLFRSFADQMDGDQHRHAYYREKICDYMRANRPDFEPFIVDESFDTFIRSLSKDGTFGGNECLVAFSRLFDARICIHQLNQPVWMVCFFEPPQHEIHISYHDYEHYSSVRKLGDHTSTTANIRQSMTTCSVSAVNEKQKKTTSNTTYGACAAESIELFTEHDVDYILSQLTNPVDPQLVRDTLNDNHGDIDGTISYLLALDIPPIDYSVVIQESNESVDKIMSITGIYNVDVVQDSLAHNNLDIDSTVESLLKLQANDDDKYEEISNEATSENGKTNKNVKQKNRPASTRQTKTDKKKAKKQRALEKHRAQIIASTGKITTTKQTEEKLNPSVNNAQESVPPTNMEFINI
ncbi:unnamed protein product [Rotaria magnacalcarata]|uniref:OTU domain-containing protein n=3 Tax=Rotaria magnacalcarata TaxID=392030 RepID=A0A817A5L7_9BILA|nr:unnamed protein product [Rotaria magnacalcarata]CAF2263894.1 unnamed protein product [Rotaria magnacalcarata]CAF3818148.1 unnamed protein product [Rotaria magnacalcarata]CAF4011113.1 unnamed protein product [Rotaria magnacalcarata]